MNIHPTAVVDKTAQLAEDVSMLFKVEHVLLGRHAGRRV